MAFRVRTADQRHFRPLSRLSINLMHAAICTILVVPFVVAAQTIPTTGLLLWLRADLGVVQKSNGNLVSWQDQSGNGNNATPAGATPPTVLLNKFNGLPVIHFDGSSQYLALPDVMGVNSSSPASAAEFFIVLSAGSAVPPDGKPKGLSNFSGGNSLPGSVYPNSDGNLYDNFGSTSVSVPIIPIVSITQANLYDLVSSPGQWTMRLNAISLKTTQSNTVSFTSAPALGENVAGQYFAGHIAEILIYNHPLTASDRITVQNYLNGKYGLVSAPSSAPTHLLAQGVSSNQVSLAWTWDFTENQDIEFTVQREAPGQNSYSTIATIDRSASYIDSTAAPGTTYSYQVQAVNSAGSSNFSNQVTVTTPLTATQIPLSALQLWLKADSGVTAPVEVWADQSGLGNDASVLEGTDAPALNNVSMNLYASSWVTVNRSAVHFNMNGQYLQLPDIMGVRGQNPATAGEVFFVLRAANAIPIDTEAKGLGIFGTSTSTGDSLYPNYDGSLWDDFGSTQAHSVAPISGVITDYSLYNLASQTGEWTMRLNRAIQYSTGTNTVAFPPNPILGMSSTAASFTSFNGDLIEIMVFDRTLTQTERWSVEFYLASKYMLPDFDLDGDGLTNVQKLQYGLNPFAPNPDGIPDWLAAELGINPAKQNPSNPFDNSKITSTDSPPLVDPTSATTVPNDPSNTTPPVITLINPDNALLVSAVPRTTVPSNKGVRH